MFSVGYTVTTPGRSALHWAVEYDKPEMLEILLKAGANKTILDEEYKEPLDIAVELSLIKCLSAVLRSCSKEVRVSFLILSLVPIKHKSDLCFSLNFDLYMN